MENNFILKFAFVEKMGHDVHVVDDTGRTQTITYISSNFSELSHTYGGIYQMHGHTGKTVAKIANKVIHKLLGEGCRYTIPPRDNNWSWGLHTLFDGSTVKMNERDFKNVYLHHMTNFRLLGELYYNYRFFSDQVFRTEPYTDEDYYSDGEEVEEASEVDE